MHAMPHYFLPQFPIHYSFHATVHYHWSVLCVTPDITTLKYKLEIHDMISGTPEYPSRNLDRVIDSSSVLHLNHVINIFHANYLCLQSVIPADSLDSDIKTLYLNITAASGLGVNHSDEVTNWL